jgi:Uma2 family endonuclease
MITASNSLNSTYPRMTLEEFLSYDDGTEIRSELVDGVLAPMGAESTINTLIAGFLFVTLCQLGLPIYRIGFKQWVAVPRGTATARDPDLIVHSDASFSAIEGRSEAILKLEDPHPMLVVEIVSPGQPGTANYDRDYVEKRREYAERGIPEYWLVDPQRQIVLVLTLQNGAYQEQGFQGKQLILSPALPSLHLTAEAMLRAGK